ncbi:hypothetical protein FVB9288_00340 [Flavobacterium sp. CECT 9288]|uniref:hypothetical protein n=1 Tax=Flavobacterium sp. CECT 9288 TaxID=2845819 RepID=UPI001E4BAC95|nr:hypothetical protein [Flavobacterium sp. CECT 9288]CAH0334735.1 hypothetical protein FVB9288_00340 [Flavobacterium sp. CECT 9288]
MKKLLLTLLLLSGVSNYSQTNHEDKQTKKEELEKELKTELNKNPHDSKKVEELIQKIAVINKKSNVLTVINDFETQAYTSNQLKPKHKQPIVFKIDNINKIANKVEITSNVVKINHDFLNGDENKVANKVKKDNDDENRKNSISPDISIKELKQLSIEIAGLENKIQLNSNLLDQKQKILNDYQIKKADEQRKGELADSQTTANYFSTITTIGNEILTLKNNFLEEQSTLVNKKNELIKLSDDLGKFTIKTNSLLAKYNCVYGKIKDINKINNSDGSYAKLVKTQIETLKRDIEVLYLLVDITGLRKKLNNVEIINNILSKKKSLYCGIKSSTTIQRLHRV